MNKHLHELCKETGAEALRIYDLHPFALMIACDFVAYCLLWKLYCLFTDTVSNESEDRLLKRTSSAHRDCRAFDASVRGWTKEQMDHCVSYFSRKYEGYGAISKDGGERLVYLHDAGTGLHLHFQINKKYALPIQYFEPKKPA